MTDYGDCELHGAMSWSNWPFAHQPSTCELDLRRQVDRALGRALVDDAHARALLATPALVLASTDDCLEQWLALTSIRATSLREFAQQALEVLSRWSPERPGPGSADWPDRLPRRLTDAAGRAQLQHVRRRPGPPEFPAFVA